MKKKLSLLLGAAALVAVTFAGPPVGAAGAQGNEVISHPIVPCGEIGNPCMPPQNPIGICINAAKSGVAGFVSCVIAVVQHGGH